MAKILRALLSEGDRRSLGRADEVVELVRKHPRKTSGVVECLFDQDPCVSMRAADVLEKLSRHQSAILQPFKPPLLNLATETTQKELRWHLALILPRLLLTPAECARAAALFEAYLEDPSSIVKPFALQGLADLALQDASLQHRVTELARMAVKTGSPAMRARGRILLKKLE